MSGTITIHDLMAERKALMDQYTQLGVSDKAGRAGILQRLAQLNGEIKKLESHIHGLRASIRAI